MSLEVQSVNKESVEHNKRANKLLKLTLVWSSNFELCASRSYWFKRILFRIYQHIVCVEKCLNSRNMFQTLCCKFYDLIVARKCTQFRKLIIIKRYDKYVSKYEKNRVRAAAVLSFPYNKKQSRAPSETLLSVLPHNFQNI